MNAIGAEAERALILAAGALRSAVDTCRYHGQNFEFLGMAYGEPRCESCQQPFRVVQALRAFDAWQARAEAARRSEQTAAGDANTAPADGAALTPFTAPASAPVTGRAGADVTPKRQYPCARCGEPLELPGPTHHECDPKVLHQGGEG